MEFRRVLFRSTSDIRGLHVRGVAGRKQSVGNLVGIERDALRNRHPCLRGGICEGFGGVIVRARRCDFGGGQMTGKPVAQGHAGELRRMDAGLDIIVLWRHGTVTHRIARKRRSEEHTSELQSLMRISYAVFCLKKTTKY